MSDPVDDVVIVTYHEDYKFTKLCAAFLAVDGSVKKAFLTNYTGTVYKSFITPPKGLEAWEVFTQASEILNSFVRRHKLVEVPAHQVHTFDLFNTFDSFNNPDDAEVYQEEFNDLPFSRNIEVSLIGEELLSRKYCFINVAKFLMSNLA